MPAIVPSLDQIGAALVVALQGVEGFSSCVHRGRYNLAPPSYPWATVSAPGTESEQGPVMGQYTRDLTYDLVIWKAASKPDLDTRVLEAEALLDEALKALEDQRMNVGSVLYTLGTWVVRSGILDALSDPVSNNALVVYLSVECSYRRTRGVSGVGQ